MKNPKCPVCGGTSPNNFGECLCSYDPAMFQPDSKAQVKSLSYALKAFQKLALYGKN